MKKGKRKALALLAACCFALLCGAGLAEQRYTVSASGAQSGHDYVLIVVEGTQNSLTLDSYTKLLYAQQKTANGATIKFEDFSPIPFTNASAFIISDTGAVLKHVSLQGTLTNMALPNSIKAIEAEAFAGMKAEEVRLPQGLERIGDRAFANCGELKWIYIPAQNVAFGANVFQGSPNVIVYGYAGSTAEAYAEQNNLLFVSL